MTTQTEAAREKLAADLKAVINDTEELLRATADQTNERLNTVRARLEERVANAKENLAEIGEDILTQSKVTAKSVDTYVRERPWQSVGIAAAVGLLIGLFAHRR